MKKALLVVLALSVTACAMGGGDPAATVEKYMRAKVGRDAEALRGMLCAKMEKQLQQEVTTFAGVAGVSIDGMVCKQDGANRVSCTGKIVALYGKEKMEFPLVAYSVVQEDGEWKYCGETR